jgi:hypothetical protein
VSFRSDRSELGRTSAAFGAAAGLTALFNAALACLKDAYQPLTNLMNAMAGHNWTTQSLADILLFVGLGLALSNIRTFRRIRSDYLVLFVVGAVAIAGLGLFAWYAVF